MQIAKFWGIFCISKTVAFLGNCSQLPSTLSSLSSCLFSVWAPVCILLMLSLSGFKPNQQGDKSMQPRELCNVPPYRLAFSIYKPTQPSTVSSRAPFIDAPVLLPFVCSFPLHLSRAHLIWGFRPQMNAQSPPCHHWEIMSNGVTLHSFLTPQGVTFRLGFAGVFPDLKCDCVECQHGWKGAGTGVWIWLCLIWRILIEL